MPVGTASVAAVPQPSCEPVMPEPATVLTPLPAVMSRTRVFN